MEVRFGSGYAHSLAADYRVTALGATVNDAIATVFAKALLPYVWRRVAFI